VTGRLAELLTGFAAPVPAILDTLGPDGAVHVSAIEEVTINRWSHGSVLLIGDAAHATSPNMAEGAAMALEDGLVLAECLAPGRGIAQTVATFQARRRPRTQWVLAQTHRRDRTRNLPPALRNLVLRRWGRNICHSNYRPLLDLPCARALPRKAISRRETRTRRLCKDGRTAYIPGASSTPRVRRSGCATGVNRNGAGCQPSRWSTCWSSSHEPVLQAIQMR
jgi:2-polyprenyl-6-methoxyphenol hydroxylase-like FAD-dependent oxidoreductase